MKKYQAIVVSDKWNFKLNVEASSKYDALDLARHRFLDLREQKLLGHDSTLWELVDGKTQVWSIVSGWKK